MTPVNVPVLVSVLGKMIENGLALPQFYDACSRGRDDSVFWLEPADMERKHAERRKVGGR